MSDGGSGGNGGGECTRGQMARTLGCASCHHLPQMSSSPCIWINKIGNALEHIREQKTMTKGSWDSVSKWKKWVSSACCCYARIDCPWISDLTTLADWARSEWNSISSHSRVIFMIQLPFCWLAMCLHCLHGWHPCLHRNMIYLWARLP